MKKILTGLKPTGELTIGNYIGAIKQMLEYNNDYETFLFVSDLHSLTVDVNPLEIHKNIRDFIALYIACGINTVNTTIYVQSDCPYIAAVSWMLECSTYFGEMSRMIQFKEKTSNNETFTVGLFTYPALMAADILVVDTDLVPVGIDQKQHVELTRDIAIRFNNKYGRTFSVPDAKITEVGTKIMDLQDPSKKMSKTADSKKGVIGLLDDLNEVRKKIMSATTDSESIIKYDELNKPGISNLINIYSGITNLSVKEIEIKFKDRNYHDFKNEVADALVFFLEDIQAKYNYILNNKELDNLLDIGSKKVNEMARIKYEDMRIKMGVYR